MSINAPKAFGAKLSIEQGTARSTSQQRYNLGALLTNLLSRSVNRHG